MWTDTQVIVLLVEVGVIALVLLIRLLASRP
jgi:hypothetical protein